MTYNPSIPQSTNNLSVSQGDLLTNFTQLNTQFGIDHDPFYTGSTNGDGFHKKVTLATKNTPGAQTDPSSAVYSGSGTASSVAQLFYKNQNATYHLSPVKAWAYCAGTVASPTNSVINSQSSGVTNVVRASTGTYTITMPANTVSSADYAVIATATTASGGTNVVACIYQISSATSFTIRTIDPILNSVVNVTSFSFMVIQI